MIPAFYRLSIFTAVYLQYSRNLFELKDSGSSLYLAGKHFTKFTQLPVILCGVGLAQNSSTGRMG